MVAVLAKAVMVLVRDAAKGAEVEEAAVAMAVALGAAKAVAVGGMVV